MDDLCLFSYPADLYLSLLSSHQYKSNFSFSLSLVRVFVVLHLFSGRRSPSTVLKIVQEFFDKVCSILFPGVFPNDFRSHARSVVGDDDKILFTLFELAGYVLFCYESLLQR